MVRRSNLSNPNIAIYLNPSLDPLVLDPFVILEPCTECHRPEMLLLDKFSDKKITYLGYESGHKPSYPNASRLPIGLQEGPQNFYDGRENAMPM